MNLTDVEMESGIAFIGDESDDPFQLFKEWFQVAQANGHLQPDALTLSTCSE